MVTMTSNKKIEALNIELADARKKLERAEDALMEVEIKILRIKRTITDTLIKLETESLPTDLYNKGCKLQEKEGGFLLVNRDGDEVCSFNHSPSLSDLMDVQYQYA